MTQRTFVWIIGGMSILGIIFLLLFTALPLVVTSIESRFASALTTTAASSSPLRSYVSPISYGIDYRYPEFNSVASYLGVQYGRECIAVLNPPDAKQLANIKSDEQEGYKMMIAYNNVDSKAGNPTPVTNDEAYESALATDLDATHPAVVTIQNEEDGLQFWTGDIPNYLHMLSLAVKVAHSKGYKVTNGGITTTGLDLAYWDYLWTMGKHSQADAFAQLAFSRQSTSGYPTLKDLPNSSNPNLPILAHSHLLAAKLTRVNALISGYKATGIDYVDFHWLGGIPATAMAEAVPWLEQQTGLPAISSAMASDSATDGSLNAILTEGLALHLSYIVVLGAYEGQNAPLADISGNILPNGIIFKRFLATHA